MKLFRCAVERLLPGAGLIQKQDKLSEFERELVTVNLMMDKGITLNFVFKLKEQIRALGIASMQYSTAAANSKYPSYFPLFQDIGIPERLLPIYPEFTSFLDSVERLDLSNRWIRTSESIYYRMETVKRFNRVLVELNPSHCLLNGIAVSKKELSDKSYHLFKKYGPKMVVIFEPDENISYGRYIEYKDVIISAIERLRNEVSLDQTGHPVSHWFPYGPTYDSIASLYPRNICEWTHEEKRLISLMKQTSQCP